MLSPVSTPPPLSLPRRIHRPYGLSNEAVGLYSNGSTSDHEVHPKSNSLFDLLQSAAARCDNGIIFAQARRSSNSRHGDSIVEERISYKDLESRARRYATVCRQLSTEFYQKPVLIHLGNQIDNIEMFWTVVAAGGIPTMSTPLSADPDQRENHLRHLKDLLKDPICITSEGLVSQYPELARCFKIHTTEEIRNQPKVVASNGVRKSTSILNGNFSSRSPAALMLTSGSTGDSKAVALTLPQIVASIRGKIDSLGSNNQWVLLNWIGLDHVANLTEIHLHAIMNGAEQVQVQANDVLTDPLLFLRFLDKYRVQYSFAPNFFLNMLEKELSSPERIASIESIDLSCLNSIVSGGEANVLKTIVDLTERLGRFTAKSQLIRVGFGMTEACAALTYSLVDSAYEAEERHEFASIGRPIRGAKVRVLLEDGLPAKSYELGSLQISGANVFKEYYNNLAATASSFTSDGWFITGDTAYYDKTGRFNLAGRAKEILNINGVKFAPADIETLLDGAKIQHVLPLHFAVFAHRADQKQTEGYCIVYGLPDGTNRAHLETVEQIARMAGTLVSMRPHWVLPITASRLDKSSLGKLSRTKIRRLFEAGQFDDLKIQSDFPLTISNRKHVPPSTDAEHKVVETLCEMLGVPQGNISTEQTIFDLGVTSITMFRFEKLLRIKFGSEDISIISFLSNPVISAIATSVDRSHEGDSYNPFSIIQSKGDKTPLWLVHAATGNTLAFLPLARKVTDRPLYALTSRGLRPNETHFSSIADMADTYLEQVKRQQPTGPYAIAGYSLGSTVAFEIAKRLDASGDKIAFCGALDSPPDISPLIKDLDWTDAAVLITYFLELIPQELTPTLAASCRNLSKEDTVLACLKAATPEKQKNLNLGPEQLLAIANVTNNFGNMAKVYVPEGQIPLVDVFYCTPLHTVGMTRQGWVQVYLSHWQDHSRREVEIHECEGDHADMLNPQNIESFVTRLDRVLEARGI